MKETRYPLNCPICSNQSQYIIFTGTRPSKNKIYMVDRLGFFDALHLAKFGFPSTRKSSYQFIRLESTKREPFYLYDPHFANTTKLTFNKKSIYVEGAKETIFPYFLIKKGNKVLFLKESPLEKKDPLKTRQYLAIGGEKDFEEG